MDKLSTRDVAEGVLAGSIGFTLAFYVMGLDLSDAFYVGGIATVSKLSSGIMIDQVLHQLSGITLSPE